MTPESLAAEQAKLKALRSQVNVEQAKQLEIRRKLEAVVTSIWAEVASKVIEKHVFGQEFVGPDEQFKCVSDLATNAGIEYARAILGVMIQRATPDNPVQVAK